MLTSTENLDAKKSNLYRGLFGKLLLWKYFLQIWTTQQVSRYLEKRSFKVIYYLLFITNIATLIYAIIILSIIVKALQDPLLVKFQTVFPSQAFTHKVRITFYITLICMIICTIVSAVILCRGKGNNFNIYLFLAGFSMLINALCMIYFISITILFYLQTRTFEFKIFSYIYHKDMWDNVQIEYKCCGFRGSADWVEYIPLSCCVDSIKELKQMEKAQEAEQQSMKCYDESRMKKFGCRIMYSKMYKWIFYLLGALLLQILGFTFAYAIIFLMKRKKGYDYVSEARPSF